MSLPLILAIAALTYASRAIALVAMPHPPDRLKAILDRIPAPLFACLAVASLIGEGGLAPAATMSAAVVALIATPSRSLLWVLVAGLLGYAIGIVVFG